MDNSLIYDLDDLRLAIGEHLNFDCKRRLISPDSEVIFIETDFQAGIRLKRSELLNSITSMSKDLVEGRAINCIEVILERFLEENLIRIKTYIWVQAH